MAEKLNEDQLPKPAGQTPATDAPPAPAANPPRVVNEITDETGQFDLRFMLWRSFCAEHNVPVETLPGDLKGEVKDKWEAMKDNNLKA